MTVKNYLRFSLSLLLFFFLPLARPPAEPSYRIMESELVKLEAISRTWETDRQTWLSQVTTLKTEAEKLRATSEILNQQLRDERTKTQSLKQSFEKLESDRLQKFSEYETEIAGLKADKSKIEISALKTKNQRNTWAFISIILASIIMVFLGIKLKFMFL